MCLPSLYQYGPQLTQLRSSVSAFSFLPSAAMTDGLFVIVALLVFLGILRLGVGVEMTAGEDDLLAVGAEKGAGRLADAGTDARHLPTSQVHRENLVERVAAVLFLGLENDRL